MQDESFGDPAGIKESGGGVEGQSGPGNSRSGPLPSLAQGPWETVILEQHGHDFRDFGAKSLQS